MADGVILLSAAQAIKAASRKVKLTHELEDSIGQLESIAKLLELNAPSPAALQRLGLLLRQTLLPLYNTFLILGIRYAVAVLATIFDAKVLPTLKDSPTNTVANWEAIQASLLSGVLDFLESNPSYETRDIVANSFYPTLRNIFFPRANPTFRPGPDLMYILCQVLSETVTLHPDNQAQLRNKEILGGHNLGLVLSQSKSIMVIEALLELIVKLLPSKRTSVAARNEFVQDVFDAANLACGDVISKILEATPPNANWDVVFIKIIDLLGNTSSSFPQPFKTSNFHLQDPKKAFNVERLYVDHLGLVANIDEGDQIETLHALYASIESLKVNSPRDGKTTVTILFSPPPSVGQVALVTPSDKRATVAFDIVAQDVARFLSSLKLRNVRNIDPPGQKISKVKESLHLNSQPSNKDGIVSTQDKGRDLARLWDLGNSQSCVGHGLPTSPLMPCAVSEVQNGSTLTDPSNPPNRGSPAKTSSPYHDSIFGTTDEELTDFSDTELNPLPRRSTRLSRGKHLHCVGKLRLKVVESDDESHIVQKTRSRRKTIVLSDVETDRVKSPQIAPQTVNPVSIESDARCSFSKLKARSSVEGTLPDDKAVDGVGGKVDQPLLKPNSAVDSPPQPDLSPSRTNEHLKPKRKRKSTGNNAPGPDSECPPSKRLRIRPGAAKTSMESKPPPKPVISKRYVRKRQTSFSNLPSGAELPFGTVPVPSSDFPIKPKEKQSKVSIVKNRRGKKSTGGSASDKKNQTVGEKITRVATVAPSDRVQAETRLPSDNNKGRLLDNMAIQDKDKYLDKFAPQRRSARVAKVSDAIDTGIKMENHVSVMPKVESGENSKDGGASKQQRLQNEPSLAPSNYISVEQPSYTADTCQNIVVRATEEPVAPTNISQDTPAQEGSCSLPMLDADFVKHASFEKAKDESKQSKPQTHGVLIDLTEDSPLLTKTSFGGRESKLRMKPSPPSENISNPQPLTSPSSPEPRHSSLKVDRPRVSFAPSASFAFHSTFDTNELGFETSDRSKEKEYLNPSNKYRSSQSHVQKPFETEYVQPTSNKGDADSMPKILGILDEINRVMKQKSSYRFSKVRKDLRAGEGAILRETAQHLEEMYVESVEHHKKFVNLEAQYASHHRKIIQGLTDQCDNQQKTATFLAATIQEHNRNSLSRKFPNNFFNSPLPSVLLNPQLKL